MKTIKIECPKGATIRFRFTQPPRPPGLQNGDRVRTPSGEMATFIITRDDKPDIGIVLTDAVGIEQHRKTDLTETPHVRV